MIRAHRIRLNPTPEQAHYFVCASGTRRFVFNWSLNEMITRYQRGEKVTILDLKKQFNAIREKEFPWSYEVTKCAIEGDDAHHKLTTYLAETFAFIGIESLNVRGMMKNHNLAQALSDVSLGKLVTYLLTKGEATGAKVVSVNTFFPSSKRCHQCHHIKDDLTLNDRLYECENCGMVCDRDLNASINILHEAIRLSESSP